MPESKIIVGDCRTSLKQLPDGFFQTIVTSPPYWGLRDYGFEEQIGQEADYKDYIKNLVEVFREARRTLKDDGTLWLNLGDTYVGTGHKKDLRDPKYGEGRNGQSTALNNKVEGFKSKDLMGLPWRVAFALQEDGWYLRSDIVWCLASTTYLYAMTPRGIRNTNIKDLVRLDPSTVKLWNGEKWTQVVGWYKSLDLEDKVKITLRSGEIITSTKNHLWPVKNSGNVKAGDLNIGQVIESTILPDSSKDDMPTYMNKDIAWLLGLYLAEGSRSKSTIQLTLHAKEIEWLPRIKETVEKLGGTIGHTVNGNKLNVRIWGKVASSIIETYISGKTAKDKHLSSDFWKLTNKIILSFMDGYLDGDGHYDTKNNRVRLGFTRNDRLAIDLRTIAARLNATLTLKPSYSKIGEKRYPIYKGEWRMVKSGHFNVKDRNAIVSITYIDSKNNVFWDIAVEDEPHLFSLSSGTLTHNCKGNVMPEPVKDRPTRSHEFIFLLSKNKQYYYDQAAVKEPTNDGKGTRNLRDVWTVNTKALPEAHFAVYPVELINPCIKAATKPSSWVLDPFNGSGTTGIASLNLGRNYVGLESNPEYADLSFKRILKEANTKSIIVK